ncbi:hypothetical protein Tco_1040471 [Tanacetum coccineum]
MCTYLKNMEGWKPKDLKSKSFANIQELFDKAMKRVNTFVDYKTELVEGSSEKAKADIAQETELKSLMEVILDEKEVAVDAIPLATKPPSITSGGLGFSLYGDLKTMFDPHVKDQVWKNLSDYIKEAKCAHSYVGRKEISSYTATITDMLNKKLKADHWNEIYFEEEYQVYGRIVRIKRLLDDLRVTADKLMLLVYKLLLSVFRVNAVITKLHLLKRLRLVEDFLLSEKG